MSYPPLLKYSYEDEFRDHYNRVYCKNPIITFDDIAVRFKKNDFNHLCKQDDDKDGNREAFAWNRAERLDWIQHALQDPDAELFFGWLTSKKKVMYDRRVALVQNNYAVTIQMTGDKTASIVTAFLLSSDALSAMLRDEKWDSAKSFWTGKK